MTEIDIDKFCNESSINSEDYWFLKLNEMKETKENTPSEEISESSDNVKNQC